MPHALQDSILFTRKDGEKFLGDREHLLRDTTSRTCPLMDEVDIAQASLLVRGVTNDSGHIVTVDQG